jgi:hypothetical protein
LQVELDAMYEKIKKITEINSKLTKKLEENEDTEDAIATTLVYLKKQAWDYKLKFPPNFFFIKTYELQRDMVRLILNLKA